MATHEFDPDDNFGHAFAAGADIDEDAAVEVLLWQLLLLINPGDEDAALQQFTACQDALADAGDEDALAEVVRDAIDWKSGFFVANDRPRDLMESIDELASRWNLRIDWGLDDDASADADLDAATLLDIAHGQLRENHYTLWTRDAGEDHHAGWMTLQDDDESLRLVAGALGMHVRTGAG